MKEFYTSKGAETALIFTLKNIYQTDAIVRYPSENILRASDGKWSQERFFTLSGTFGTRPISFDKVYVIVDISRVEIIVSRFENIDDNIVRIYHKSPINVALDQLVEVISNEEVIWAGGVINAPSSIDIVYGGSNWQLGQILIFPGSVNNTVARITALGPNDSILHAEILEYGWVHGLDQTIIARPSIGSSLSEEATLRIKLDSNAKLPGHWKDISGQISNQDIRIEDNYYYQQFSYDVESSVNPMFYYNLIKTIHPSGTKLFTTEVLKQSVYVIPTAFTTYPYKSISIFDNLSGSYDSHWYNLTKYFNDTSSPSGEFLTVGELVSLHLTKNVIPSITDSITASTGDISSISSYSGYAEVGYFENPTGAIYAISEFTLTLS
jgi:hypothetical protein